MDITHIRGKSHHPQTQGKTERYHQSMKNVIKLDNYYSPGELKSRLDELIEHYNLKGTMNHYVISLQLMCTLEEGSKYLKREDK